MVTTQPLQACATPSAHVRLGGVVAIATTDYLTEFWLAHVSGSLVPKAVSSEIPGRSFRAVGHAPPAVPL